jgi:hypothetical protein
MSFQELVRSYCIFADELPRNEVPRSKKIDENFSQKRHPRMFLSGVQSEFRLDSR